MIDKRAEDIAWAAGLFEGEGSFSTYSDGRSGRRYLRATMSQTDLDVLERFCEVVGMGRIYKITNRRPDHRRQAWHWSVQTEASVTALFEMMRPHLGRRRAETAERLKAEYGRVHRHQARLL